MPNNESNTAEYTQKCPLQAQAWIDGQLVAESQAALRIEAPNTMPILCFPQADLRTKLPTDEEVLRTPVPEGYVAFNHENARVQVLLVDPMGPDERDRTTKRFPTWGDVDHLVNILDVRPDGNGGYVSTTRDNSASNHRGVVEGSQMLGQAIVAAGRHAPGRRTVHASMVFMRAADAAVPLHFSLEQQQGGRTFSTLAVKVTQNDRLCASGILLLDATAESVMNHSAEPPATKGPYASVPFDMNVTGRDLRIVDGAYTSDPDAPVGPPIIDAWMRYLRVPADPYLHAALVAQFTGHLSIAAAMRPHAGFGEVQAHRTLSTAINAINISLHADIRADEWMLVRHLSTFSGAGMTHSECRVHNEAGQLLASFSVDAMVRPMPKRHQVNERTSL